MEYRKEKNTYYLRLDKGEEVIEALTAFVKKEQIRSGSITGLGATDEVEFGLFDTKEKKYHSKTIKEAMEITSLVGNISTKDKEVYLHLHINVGKEDGTVWGGHLNRCMISATGELVVQKTEMEVEREFSEAIGLNLWKFEQNDRI